MSDVASSPTARVETRTLAELALVIRSGLIESRHFGHLLALQADGSTALELGDPDAEIFPRSTVKPLQALACMRAGAQLRDEQLAITCGSHTGQQRHTKLTAEMLASVGLDEHALQCPVDFPEDPEARREAISTGRGEARITMNCSGKHAGMLVAAARAGWPVDTYLSPEHPLQQLTRQAMEDLTGVPVGHVGVDGCGAPLFSTSVRGIAHAFRALALAEPGTNEHAVAQAMRQYPQFVGGDHHANTDAMLLIEGAISKGGAEGVIGVADAEGRSVSMKIIDGSPRATTLIALRVLEALGTDTSRAQRLTHIDVLGAGKPVGEIVPGADLHQWIDRAQVTA